MGVGSIWKIPVAIIENAMRLDTIRGMVKINAAARDRNIIQQIINMANKAHASVLKWYSSITSLMAA